MIEYILWALSTRFAFGVMVILGCSCIFGALLYDIEAQERAKARKRAASHLKQILPPVD